MQVVQQLGISAYFDGSLEGNAVISLPLVFITLYFTKVWGIDFAVIALVHQALFNFIRLIMHHVNS